MVFTETHEWILCSCVPPQLPGLVAKRPGGYVAVGGGPQRCPGDPRGSSGMLGDPRGCSGASLAFWFVGKRGWSENASPHWTVPASRRMTQRHLASARVASEKAAVMIPASII